MADDATDVARTRRIDRERVMRTLTFWLRPEFVLRVVNRFQKIAGFDRAIALASSALTASIPLALVVSAIATKLGLAGAAERIIDRYDLTGEGAQAVRDVLAPATGVSTSLGFVGLVFLLLTVLSFSRVVQRLFEQTWELPSLGVRNSLNGLIWVGGLALYFGLVGALHGALGRTTVLEIVATLAAILPSAVFLVWTGSVLSAKRIERQALVPFGLVGAALLAAYSIGAQVYLPHTFSTYATRYGVIGAVFALLSALFCIAVITVGSAAAGREIRDELDRIARGERPAEHEVRLQWEAITAEARSRRDLLRTQLRARRRPREPE
jgi:uncharacterized BrkB/YihY/UPF0761 family membrane protein